MTQVSAGKVGMRMMQSLSENSSLIQIHELAKRQEVTPRTKEVSFINKQMKPIERGGGRLRISLM